MALLFLVITIIGQCCNTLDVCTEFSYHWCSLKSVATHLMFVLFLVITAVSQFFYTFEVYAAC